MRLGTLSAAAAAAAYGMAPPLAPSSCRCRTTAVPALRMSTAPTARDGFVVPLLTWGTEADRPSGVLSGRLMELSASYGWCLNDVELAEMQRFQEELTEVTSYLKDDEIRRLRLAVEVAYQSRAWSDERRSEKRLAHSVAVARVLAEQQMEAEAIIAALLAGASHPLALQSGVAPRLPGALPRGRADHVAPCHDPAAETAPFCSVISSRRSPRPRPSPPVLARPHPPLAHRGYPHARRPTPDVRRRV